MKRLFVALVAVMAMFAFPSVAYSQGAAQFDCAEIGAPDATGQIVVTPGGPQNNNCNLVAPSGSGAAVVPCEVFHRPGVSGNVVFTPGGHQKFHCKFPAV